jgi:hypothetical protein
VTHLSDDDIQQYLDGGAVDPLGEKHLDECTSCSNSVRLYRSLYAGLADSSTFPPLNNLAAGVTLRLSLRRRKRRWLPSPEAALAAAGIAGAIALTFIFLNTEPFIEALSRIRQAFLDYTFPVLEGAGANGGGLRPSLAVAIWGVIVAISAGTLDRLLSRRLRGRAAGR